MSVVACQLPGILADVLHSSVRFYKRMYSDLQLRAEGESKQLLVLRFNVRQVDLRAADQYPGQDGLCGSSSLDTVKKQVWKK